MHRGGDIWKNLPAGVGVPRLTGGWGAREGVSGRTQHGLKHEQRTGHTQGTGRRCVREGVWWEMNGRAEALDLVKAVQ